MTTLLTADEVAVLLRTSRWMIYERVKKGYFTPGIVVKLGRSIRFSASGLETLIAQGGQGLPAPQGRTSKGAVN